MKPLKLGLLAKELLLVAPIMLLGLWVSSRYYATVAVERMSTGYSVPWFLVSFAIAVGLILLLIKFIKTKWPFRALISLTLFLGAVIVFDAFIPSIYSLVIAAALIVLYWAAHTIAIHDLLLIVAIAGVSVYLGLLLPVTAILILFGAIAVYDIFAVFRTGHMVEMFTSMASRGAVMALVIPEKLKHVGQKVSAVSNFEAKGKTAAMFLGTGDAAFPTMLAVAAMQTGKYSAYGAVIGALAGVIVIHFVLMRVNRPLPALPPIALLSATGYFIGLLV